MNNHELLKKTTYSILLFFMVLVVSAKISIVNAETINLINNFSFETAINGQPSDWLEGKWGTNDASFTYIQNEGHSGTSSSKVSISNYVSGDAKWYFKPVTTLTPGSDYTFSAWYKTNTSPRIVAAYTDGAGIEKYIELANPMPGINSSVNWQEYNTKLTVPTNTKSLTVFFLISGNGWLQTDDFSMSPYIPTGFNNPIISITFDDGWDSIYKNGLPLLRKYGFVSTQYIISGKLSTRGYMNTKMLQEMKSAGNEIASHTVNHPNLTTLTDQKIINELKDSQSVLRTLFGLESAQNFTSPYGAYNINTINYTKLYYQSHRSTDIGFNTKDTLNTFNILVQVINTNTTPYEVSSWVNKAKNEKLWLVIVYHAVINSNNQGDYSVTPANLDKELQYIKASGVQVKTIEQALSDIQSK